MNAKTSLILALHARYEAAWDEYNRLDNAKLALDESVEEERRLSFRYDDAMRRNQEEVDALRVAILLQVPSTDEELSILAFHMWSLYDSDSETASGIEKRALEEGLNSTFDYLVGEGRCEMDRLGRQFANGASLAFDRRRFRTGQLED
ncbi:MAG TPA: hypothetical protein VM346_01175 [Sphingomicrobium sp.]|nr:hypothetical protein [Sphingomicrobium sp.]